MTTIALVLGSVRPGRWCDQVATWIADQAAAHEGTTLSVIDLRDYNLPFFNEPLPPSMENPKNPEAVRLRETVDAVDAVIFLTPEYNHSVPAVLKNAIDFLPPATLKEKPVALVGYSWHSAESSLSHLREILWFAEGLREKQIGINMGTDAQDGAFAPSEELNQQLREILASLSA